MLPVVLFVNHREKSCGVQQFGKRLYDALATTTNFTPYYIDIDRIEEFNHWADTLQPSIVLYNFYTAATMPWLSPTLVQRQRGRFRQLSIFHEVPIDSMGFDLILHQDPTFKERDNYVRLARPIPHYSGVYGGHTTPVFGSFGFGLGGKGFDRVVKIVSSQYDSAVIRLNIPYATFGDAGGSGAQQWAALARASLSGSNIELQVTHYMFSEPKLLEWLGQNTANCFFYDENYGRGISGTLDYALAVHRPIAITRSYQFQHMWTVDDSFLIENKTLPEIVDMGTDHLDKFHTMWGDKALVADFERAFNRVLGV